MTINSFEQIQKIPTIEAHTVAAAPHLPASLGALGTLLRSNGTSAAWDASIHVAADGKVGIGETSPNQKLVVGANGSNTAGVIATFNAESVAVLNTPGALVVGSTDAIGINKGGSLGFTANGTIANYPTATIHGKRENSTDANYAGYLAFTTCDSAGTLDERMRITSTGNLRVGGSGNNTNGKLEVRGNNTDTALYVTNGSNSNFSVNFDSAVTTIGNDFYGKLKLQTLGSPALTINESGAILLLEGQSGSSTRPAVGATRLSGELSGAPSNDAADDGFLRLSAGGGSTVGQKAYIDISGYSTVADMNNNIVFGTLGAEKMRITSGGNVGIGGTPSAQLDVIGSSPVLRLSDTGVSGLYHILNGINDTSLLISADGGNVSANSTIEFRVDNTERMRIGSNGSVGIGGAAAELFQVTGNTGSVQVDTTGTNIRWTRNGINYLVAQGGTSAIIQVIAGAYGGVQLNNTATAWAAISDIRAKKNIQPLQYGLNEILAINPVRFDYINDDSEQSKRMGFIAQELLPIVSEAVCGTGETQYSVMSTELIPTLVKAIQELSVKLDEANAKILALEALMSI